MSNPEFLGLILALVGCFIGLAGWLSGREKRIANDAEWRGIVNTKLDLILIKQEDICSDVDELSAKVGDHGNRLTAVEASLKSLHHRLTEAKAEKG